MHVQYTSDYHFCIHLEYHVSCFEKSNKVSVTIVFNTGTKPVLGLRCIIPFIKEGV